MQENRLAKHNFKTVFLSYTPEQRASFIASALGYCGDDIFQLLCDALTDANFHAEVQAIKSAYIETMQLS